MNPTERDYEQVGQWLDGQEAVLTPPQRALAEEIAADARRVGRALDLPAPAGMLHRVHGRMKAAGGGRPVARLAARRGVTRWLAGAAAAAAVLLAAVLLWPPGRPAGPGGPTALSPDEYVGRFLQSPAGELDARIQIISEELADYHVQLVLGEAWSEPPALGGLEQQVRDFILGEAAAPAEQELWEEPL